MKARQVVIGCSVAAVAAVIVVGVGAFLVFRQLAAPAPLPAATSLVAGDSVGLALLRLEPDNTWVKEAFTHLTAHSKAPPPDLARVAPLEVVWTARHASPASENHLVAMTLAPSGRFLGLTVDLALWKAGRGGEPLVKRVEHAGEGITSFPGARIPGSFFVRGATIAWGSDLDAARHGVDLMAGGGNLVPPDRTLPVLDLYPSAGKHTLRGALIEKEGCLGRILASLPGAESAPPDLTGVEGLAFTLDPSGATEGAGELRLLHAEAVDPDQRARNAAALAAWVGTLSPAGVRLQASPRGEAPGETLTLTASDLDGVFATLLRAAARAERAMKRGREEPAEAPADDQSSSTFQ
jgi:hypothetical protein